MKIDCRDAAVINTYLYRAVPEELALLAEQAHTFLSAPETARWQRFRHSQSQMMYLAGRYLVRSVLARRLGCRMPEVPLQVADSGKPFLDQSVWPGSFNLSHSGDYLLLGIADAVTLGVDIECCTTPRDLDGIAAMIMHPDELADFQQLPLLARTDYFFRVWVAKESLVKMLGTGISYGLKRICLNGELTAFVQPDRVGLARLDAPAGFMAALVYAGDDHSPLALQQSVLTQIAVDEPGTVYRGALNAGV